MPWESIATYMGIRSRFFDGFFAATSADRLNQVVLASGLNTHAYRLDRPQATVVYEIDAPKVLEFKDTVLTEEAAHTPLRPSSRGRPGHPRRDGPTR